MKKTLAPTRTIICKKTHNQIGEDKKTASKQPVKTLEIFISNLDQHIADSYIKLKNSKHKTISLNSTIKKQLQSVENSAQKQTKTKNYDFFQGEGRTLKKSLNESTRSLLQNGFEEKENPTLISNEQVTKYINFVYQTYKIPDPLTQNKRQKKITIVKQSQRKNSLTTINLRHKSSLSSFKEKIVMQKNIDLTPMKTHEAASHLNTTNNSVHEEFDNSKFNSTLFSVGSSSSKYEIIRKDSSKRFAENYGQNQAQVQQLFRYCFACEDHVLQKNLKFHQQVCKPLQEAYLKTYPQLLTILNHKITRLTTQVQAGIVEAQPQNLVSQFTNFKQAVSEWIRELGRMDKENSNGIHNNQISAKYNQIQQKLTTNFSFHLQSLSRLSWFSRLRSNLLRRMSSQ